MSNHLETPTLKVKRGDSVARVQELIGMNLPPERMAKSDNIVYFYHLSDIGFWVFFDERGAAYSIRIESPFPHPVQGVQVGDSKEKVLEQLGKPHRYLPVPDSQNRWIYDREFFLRVDFAAANNRIEKIFI